MRVAMCQIPVSDDPKINLERAREALATAAEGGAGLAVFPEATMARFGSRLDEVAEPVDGPFATALAEEAKRAGVAVVAGAFEPSGDGRIFNTALAIDAAGELRATYRKIHLFDAFGYKESDSIAPGDAPVVVELGGVRYGLITCYDIRFPELARALVDQGAQVLLVIAAWGAGLFKEEHWLTLVRARAIENTTWTLAVDQVPDPEGRPGRAPTGVGRSLAVDPFGVTRTDLGSAARVELVEVDLADNDRARAAIPALGHRRPDILAR